MTNIAGISLGTNIEPREKHLKEAIELLREDACIQILATSSIYETDPVGYLHQPSFLNMVIFIEVEYGPKQLLRTIQCVETTLGRIRDIRFGPRTIDLDILVYNKENIYLEELTIPHPRISERAFVGIPLSEAYLELKDIVKEKVKIPLLDINNKGVKIWKRTNGEEELERFES